MSKHTPGPWTIVETTDPVVLSYWHIQVGAHQLPFFPYKRIYSADRTQSGFVGDPEIHANARLIAAAPDMHEALQSCVMVMERDLAGVCLIQPELEKARAAIAKAEGK